MNVPSKSMVGSDVFPIELVPILGDIRSFSGVYFDTWTMGSSKINQMEAIEHVSLEKKEAIG